MGEPTKKQIVGAAIAYARRGWPVFPLFAPSARLGCTCSARSKCDKPGKHPRWECAPHGLKSAVTDEATIKKWWKEYPKANIAIVCGAISGLAVVDVDPKHDGDKTLAKLEKEHGKLPETLTVLTGSGGHHYYFEHPGGKLTSRKNFTSLDHDTQKGMDSQADGAYVVAPPSLHASGERYKWEGGNIPIASMPKWLLALIPAPKAAKASKARRSQGGGRGKDEFNDGERNAGLFSIGCALRRWGAGEKMIYAALSGINAECCVDPLDDEEVERIARSISNY